MSLSPPAPGVLRVALTETSNAYRGMPATLAGLAGLTGELEAIRRANVEHNLGLIDRAVACGAAWIGLGELCTGPYFALTREPLWRGLAEDAATGPSVLAFRERARAHGVTLVAPIYERDPVSGRRFNTAVVIGSDGELLGKYRKCHIPEGGNEQGSFHETFYYGASDGELGEQPGDISGDPYFPVFDTGRGRLGVAICYDRHFEGVIRSLAAGGAQVVFVPAVTFGATSRRMWRLEAEVDALRHRVILACSNRRGAEAPWGQPFFGDSFIVGPGGSLPPLMDALDSLDSPDSRGSLFIADLDLGGLGGGESSGWELARDRRPEIYRP